MYSLINGIAKNALSSFMPMHKDSGNIPRFEKDLIYKLMCSHQNQYQLYVELRVAAQRFDHTRARRLLRKLSKLHFLQTITERSKLYPLIKGNRPEADDLSALVDNIQMNAAMHANDVKLFCSFWCQKLDYIDNIQHFTTALDVFGEMLDKLITDKEMKLYPLYNRSSTKQFSVTQDIYNG